MVTSKLLTPEQAETKIVSRVDARAVFVSGPPRSDAIMPWLGFSHRELPPTSTREVDSAQGVEIGKTDHPVMMGVELADHLVFGKPEVTWASCRASPRRHRMTPTPSAQ